MNTNDLKYFGQEARKLLMSGVSRKLAFWGFNSEGIALEEPSALHGGYIFRGMVYDDPTVPVKWNKLQEAVKQNGFNEVVEKAAYVWFNRLIALQILGKNEYDLPQLEPASADEATPLILKRARQGQYGFLNPSEQDRLKKILTDYENETQAFAILLIGYCHHHALLNNVFGGIDDYTELLLPDDILAPGGFLDFLNNGGHITNEDYTKVELIGWLYQFYISEKKDEVFKNFKANKKAEKEDIPAATQIFTPNWIVKYMVENTVGRIWLDLHPSSPIREQMKYLVEPSEKTGEQGNSIISEVKELKLLDPAVGSGHILVEGFELLYAMYMEELYPADEAVESILQHNLFGLDIDVRAAQLAQFAVLMKAAQKYPGILQKNITPHIYAMPEPVSFTKEDMQLFLGEDGTQYLKPLQDALHLMLQAQNLGAIMQFEISEQARGFVIEQLNQWQQRTNLDLLEQELLTKLGPYLQILKVLSQKYEATSANPPYMGQKNMNDALKKFVNQNYQLSKSDLMTVFMEVVPKLTVEGGMFALINLPSWLFLGSFEELRNNYLKNYSIQSLLHMGRGIFGIDFGSVTFSLRKERQNKSYGTFFRLHEKNFQHIYYEDIKKLFLYSNSKVEYRYDFSNYRDEEGIREIPERSTPSGLQILFPSILQENFSKIPGSPIAYWVTERVIDLFKQKKIGDAFLVKQGLATCNNELFVRLWHEVSVKKIGISLDRDKAISSSYKWFPYNKGGAFKKWYGLNTYIVNWLKNGSDIHSYNNIPLNYSGAPVRAKNFYFKEGLTYNLISSGDQFTSRYIEKGFVFDVGGSMIFANSNSQTDLYYLLALNNSKITSFFLKIINPTFNFQVGDIVKVPLLIENSVSITALAKENLSISKRDWDSRELSWSFTGSPLFNYVDTTIRGSFNSWLKEVSFSFFTLHTNEETINKILLSVYGLEKEVGYKVAYKNLTILEEELDHKSIEQNSFNQNNSLPVHKDVILAQLISFSIGCNMGRYRLDKPGLQIANPNPTSQETAPYSYKSPITNQSHIFNIDEDAVIPLMGEKCIFTDDAVQRFQEFVQIIWGDNTLTQNLNFVQECLNREIEDYLVNHFWKYHVKMYSKKPIYWLFASKRNAFQVLVYMHRMNRFTVEKIRDKYLLKHIQHLQQQTQSLEAKGGALTREEQKKLDQLRTDELECSEYELVLKDVATQQIEFDLDDGVTKNYALFYKVVAPIK